MNNLFKIVVLQHFLDICQKMYSHIMLQSVYILQFFQKQATLPWGHTRYQHELDDVVLFLFVFCFVFVYRFMVQI